MLRVSEMDWKLQMTTGGDLTLLFLIGKRNSLGGNRLSVGRDCAEYHTLASVAEADSDVPEPVVIEGISGTISASEVNVRQGDNLPSPVLGLRQITDNSVVTVTFEDPKYDRNFIFPAIKLKGAVDPPKVLKDAAQNQSNQYNHRPMTGMVRQEWQQGARVNQAGHRMINAYSGHNNNYSSNRQGGYNTAEYDYQQRQQQPYRGRGGAGSGGYNQDQSRSYQSESYGGGSGHRGGRGNDHGSGGYNSRGNSNRYQPYPSNRYGGVASGQYQRGRGAGGGGGYNNARGGGGGAEGYHSQNNRGRGGGSSSGGNYYNPYNQRR